MEIVISIVILLCGLVGAMAIKSKRNERKMVREAIIQLREVQRAIRFRRWQDKAREWKIELKKPIKVQFD